MFCHLLAELSDIEINPTDFDFSESGETTTDCGPEWTDEDEAQFEQCEATNFSEPGFTACEELAIRQFCLFNDQDWEDDWDNDWEDDWDSEWADWEDSSTENISVIAKCGHIPNFSDLEFVYQCFYKEDSSSSSLNCEEY